MTTGTPTPGEKLLKRLAQHRMALVRFTVVVDKDGQPVLVAVEEVQKLEQLAPKAMEPLTASNELSG